MILTLILHYEHCFDIGLSSSPTLGHRGLKLDGGQVKGKFVTPSKVKNFQNPSCPILEKNKILEKIFF